MFQLIYKKNAIPLIAVFSDEFETWYESQSSFRKNWVTQQGFTAQRSEFCIVPNIEGQIDVVLYGIKDRQALRWVLSSLSTLLPVADYCLEGEWCDGEKQALALGWALGQYSFDRFKENKTTDFARLYVEDPLPVLAMVDAVKCVRDLINTPANHMMPEHLSAYMKKLAMSFNASFSEVIETSELVADYPAIHAVGRASDHAPRLLRLEWGDTTNPDICLVGKGVCFDTGGLDLKPSRFMRTMKKDMGGAAHVLGLASMVMANKLPIHLTILIPAVDNAISGDAFRPGDIINTRLGKTVEIDNTDAEGRLVLCDALAEAAALQPELIIDFATLTGAARVALGTEVPVFFTNTTVLSDGLRQASEKAEELIWELPLHKPYLSQLDSMVADIANSSPEGYGGAITAALFLNEFVPKDVPWVHFDVMAWNTRHRSGRPVGGEAMGLFAVYQYLQETYSGD